MDKMCSILDEVGKQVSSGVFVNNPIYKVTKGENYKRLPYVVVDCPQLSGPHLPLACRTLFWWGYGFSFNLIIPQAMLANDAADSLSKLEDWILIGDHLWENEIDDAYYKQGLTQTAHYWKEHISNQTYVRIACMHGLHQYERINEMAVKWYGDRIKNLTA